MSGQRNPEPWVIVCGGFHRHGGMDRANYELANELLRQGFPLHLVSHEIDHELLDHALVTAHLVPRPFGSILLGEHSLLNTGLRIANAVKAANPRTRVVVNGGNCDYPDINWVHSVHHAWPRFDRDAPRWFRTKSALNKRKALRDERRSFENARLLVANSERTRRDLLAMDLCEDHIRVLYLGSDPAWRPADSDTRSGARRKFGLPVDATVACFVGALGYDRNKGFDLVLEAMQRCENKKLIVLAAGGGRGLTQWRKRVSALNLGDRVHLIGFSSSIDEVYAAADLLVSPVRYEAFGLNVLEAICRGLPSIVSRNAGMAELYPPELATYLLSEHDTGIALARLLDRTVTNLHEAKASFAPLSVALRHRSWKKMAEEFIAIVAERHCG